MNDRADKEARHNTPRSAEPSMAQRRPAARSTLAWVDQRPEAIAQRKLRDMAAESAQVEQLRAVQKMADDSPQAGLLRTIQRMADDSPRVKQHRGVRQMVDDTLTTAGHPGQRGAMPEPLRAGLEHLSGMDLSGVSVNYNSSKPAQLNAHAYTEGRHIEIAPGQTHHLPHEGWHVVQQMQGRVKPTMQAKGQAINDDAGLEHEADVMGAKALQLRRSSDNARQPGARQASGFGTVQLRGVGGAKIAFEKREQAAKQDVIDEGMKLLKAAWKEAVGMRKAEKARIGAEMAEYDKAVKDGDQATLHRMEHENDLRNRPEAYDQKRVADDNLSAHLKQIDDRKSDLFRDHHSVAIFGEARGLDNVADADEEQKKKIGKAIPTIMQDAQIREWSKATKGLRDVAKLADANLQARPKSTGLTQVYFDRLIAQIPDEDVLLQRSKPFKEGKLSLAGSEVTYHHGSGAVVICDLRKGLDAYALSKDAPALGQQREVFNKKGQGGGAERPKDYVKDSRGVLTRRYAYVEKNYHQMMEFFTVGHMTGRFQQYMLAGGQRTPGVHKFTTDMIRNVPKPTAVPQTQMTDTQVAVAHQMYGSLPEQRGVSLSSTPKVGVTYANTGGNFRTDEGFKLKIDLARVPKDVLFLNHYSEGGVADLPKKDQDYQTHQSHKKVPYDYKYLESATHARELFLEHIRPEWVVEIEHHQKGGYQNIGGQKAIMGEGSVGNLFEAAKAAFGGREFEEGFEVGLNAAPDVPGLTANRDYTKGKDTGKLVRDGYEAGVKARADKHGGNHMDAFGSSMNDKGISDKYSQFHIGYMQGRTGQPMVRSALELRMLLNTEKEFKDPAVGGTVAFSHDATKLLIKWTTALSQGAGFKTRMLTVPFEDLHGAKFDYDTDDETDIAVVTIVTGTRPPRNFTLSVPSAQAANVVAMLQKYTDENARQLTTRDTEAGGSHGLYLDAGHLRTERHTKNHLGVHKLGKSNIALDTIKKVEFQGAGNSIEIAINHGGSTYEMNVTRAAALQIRTMLLRSGLDERIVGPLPAK